MSETDRRTHQGFSLIELLVVVSVIAILAAVSVPAIARTIRNYQLNASAQEVAAQLQQARSRAIQKNVNLGVVFAITSQNTMGWVMEDDLRPQTAPNWSTVPAENWPTLVADQTQSNGLRQLRSGMQFDSPANCPQGAAASRWGLRFNRMGGSCAPLSGSTTCPNPGGLPAMTNYIGLTAANEAVICLRHIRTGLRRTVVVQPGGRIQVRQ